MRMRLGQPVVGTFSPRPLGQFLEAASASLRGTLASRRAGALAILAALSGTSVVTWTLAVRTIDPLSVSDVGLLPSIPPVAFLAMLLLAVAYAAALRMQPLPQILLGTQLVIAVFMLYGAPMLFEELPRFVTAWLHVGFVDAIARTGELFANRDARFDWPGFFVLFAFLQGLAGSIDLVKILDWVPVILTVLCCVPLYLIARSATGDPRLVWLTLWIFVLTNWVGQDYFSPQGMNFLLFLTIIAILLTWFRRPPSRSGWQSRLAGWLPGAARPVTVDPDAAFDGGLEPHVTDRQQLGLVVIVVLVFGLSVASHQLTPFAAMGGVMLLALAGRLRPRGMPMLMIVIGMTWLVFMATTFLDGRVSALLADVGRPDQFATTNVAERLVGSAGHVIAVQGRLVFTLLVWSIAFVGGVRRLRSGRLDLSLGLLALAPFGLVLVQGYGGEMILRVYLFAVPFMAFFAAATLVPTIRRASLWHSWAVVGLSMVLAVGFIFARYGNERADIVTQDDLGALTYIATAAEPGSIIATPNSRAAPEYIRFEDYRYPDLHDFIGGDAFGPAEFDKMLDALDVIADPGDVVYFLVTHGTEAHAELVWGMDEAEWNQRMGLLRSRLDVLYRRGDAMVLRWIVPGLSQ